MSGRSAGPADLRGVVAFLERVLREESGVVVAALPAPLAAAAAASWVRYIPSLLGLGSRVRVYLDDAHGELRSVALVESGHRAEWVVLALVAHPGPGGADSAFRLLSHVASAAARHGIHRVFAAAPDQPRAQETLFQAGFYSYTRASWLVLAGAPRAAAPRDLAAQPATGADAHDLFRLYLAATPHAVQRAEQLSIDHFDVTRPGAFDPVHEAGGDPLALRRAAVFVDRRGDLLGASVAAFEGRARHPHVLRIRMSEPDVDRARDLARLAVRSLTPGHTVAAPVRAYEEHVARALAADGFLDAGTAMLFVKELAIRVEEPAFVPAVVR